MFQHLNKSEKYMMVGVLSAVMYFLFSLIFGIGQLLTVPTFGTVLKILPSFWPVKLLISAGFSYLMVYTGRNLDDIEAKTAGQGQHGSARWATQNVFSSALGKLVDFIDAELEPLVCGHSPELNDLDFIKEPTAVFLVCPDENTTRHFFASLFIRFFMNDLVAQAEENHGILKRKVLAIWDEFGNMPPVKSLDVLFTAVRSRGIRFLISLQSFAQLEKNYSRNMAQVIRDACQMNMFTYVSPSSRGTAEELSKTLGNRTVQSGSISMGKHGSESLQLMGRALLTPDEIIHMKQGDFVTMKAGALPVQTRLPLFWDYLPKYPDYLGSVKIQVEPIAHLTVEKLLSPQPKRVKLRLFPGQFD